MPTVIKTQQINKITVSPVIAQGGEPDADLIKGYDYIPLLYANIFLCAKKKSGKTNVIYNLLDHLAGPKTVVYLFASTVHKDSTYAAIMKMLKKKNITFEAHVSFFDKAKKGNKLSEILMDDDEEAATVVFEKKSKIKKPTVGHQSQAERQKLATLHYDPGPIRLTNGAEFGKFLSAFNRIHGRHMSMHDDLPSPMIQASGGPWHLEELGADYQAHRDPKAKDPSLRKYLPVFGPPETKIKKGVVFGLEAPKIDYDDADLPLGAPKKERKTPGAVQAPETIFVFDDLGSDLRHPSISQLLKTNRHEKSKVILSSQYLTDLQPQAIKQLDYCMLFKAFGEDKLRKIYEHFDFSIDYGKFLDLYKYATEAPFSFLFIDVRTENFRKNFNIKLSVDGLTAAHKSKEDEKAKPETTQPVSKSKSNPKPKSKSKKDTDEDEDDEDKDSDQEPDQKKRK